METLAPDSLPKTTWLFIETRHLFRGEQQTPGPEWWLQIGRVDNMDDAILFLGAFAQSNPQAAAVGVPQAAEDFGPLTLHGSPVGSYDTGYRAVALSTRTSKDGMFRLVEAEVVQCTFKGSTQFGTDATGGWGMDAAADPNGMVLICDLHGHPAQWHAYEGPVEGPHVGPCQFYPIG